MSGTKTYKYPFDYGNFVKQTYLNDKVVFYRPSNFGFEKRLKKGLPNSGEMKRIMMSKIEIRK